MSTPIPLNQFACDPWLIAAATGGRVRRVADRGANAVGVVTDSRSVFANCVYFALKGDAFDGHAFAKSAEERGASIVVVEKGRAEGVTLADVIEVEDTLVALGALARARLLLWRRENPGACTVAITGSAGKTTTKEICAALLSAVGPCHKSAGNLNNRVGVPSVALALESSAKYAVFEAGMNRPGEIAALASIVAPDVAILTNVGVAHAAGVGGGRDMVGREKGALLEALSLKGVAIVNGDDPVTMAQTLRTRARIVTFGRNASTAYGASGAYRLIAREPLGLGARMIFSRPGSSGQESIDVPVPGEAFAQNTLAALAAVDAAIGRPLAVDVAQKALVGLRLESRFSLVELGSDALVIDDSYNANPASYAASLSTLAELGADRRRVAVVGEMKELGSLGEVSHRELGRELARARVDLVIGCGGALLSVALEEARAQGVNVVACNDVHEAAEKATLRIQPRDVVLVKGSRSVGAEVVVAALIEKLGRADSVRGESPTTAGPASGSTSYSANELTSGTGSTKPAATARGR